MVPNRKIAQRASPPNGRGQALAVNNNPKKACPKPPSKKLHDFLTAHHTVHTREPKTDSITVRIKGHYHTHCQYIDGIGSEGSFIHPHKQPFTKQTRA